MGAEDVAERFTPYLDAVMAMPPKHIRRELNRLQGKLVDAQKLSVSTSPIGRILFR